MAKNTKKSITFKVIIGYLLLITFAAISFWFIYNNVINLNKANQLNTYNQQKLSLISEAVTNLYTAESVSRDIIQNQKPENLPLFNQQIDTISSIITTLKNTYDEKTIRQELDSLQNLLQLKEQNLLDLLDRTGFVYCTEVTQFNKRQIPNRFNCISHKYLLHTRR